MEHLFADGFADLTMAELAARLNCSLRTLYALAPSRDELVLIVVDRNLWRIGRAARDAIGQDLAPLDAVRAYLEAATVAVSGWTEAFARDLAAVPAAQRLADGHNEYLFDGDPHAARPRGGARATSPSVDTAAVARVLAGLGRFFSRPDVIPTPAVVAEGGRRRGRRPGAARPAQPLPEWTRGAPMTDVREVAADLRAEQDALDAVVAGLTDEQWRLADAEPGWTVADQIGHLTYFDGAAATAIADPHAFKASIERAARPTERRMDDADAPPPPRPAELLEAWRANRRRLADGRGHASTTDPRVAWYGPSMGAKSFLTARLMECWAHGQDVADAVGGRAAGHRPAPPHRPARRSSPAGGRTSNRGLERAGGRRAGRADRAVGRRRGASGPTTPPTSCAGPALDFCLVVTQRRHVDDTALEVTGRRSPATGWRRRRRSPGRRPTAPPRGGA